MNKYGTARSLDAENAYIRQHATIVTAIEHLQAALDQMQAPDESEVPIGWQDVAEFAHVAEAADALIERIRS